MDAKTYKELTKAQLKRLKKLALEIAKDAHKGQKRWDGSPYISHPIAVAQALKTDEEKIVGLLHDVMEDCPDFDRSELDQFGIKICFALVLLTKRENQNYGDYLSNLKITELHRKVKIADIKHNLSDLHKYPKKKDLMGKYQVALIYLEDV